ncbi:MAG: MBL fold metallo-hydrolase [Crocinitomicaceae bacterium]|tara:strand:- start:305 stop:952 length:648 start_codon:yes stop_codon:yes gene_type:complete
MSLEVASFQFNGFQENTYIVIAPSKNCVIIDPGCYESHEEKELFDFIENKGLKPIALLNTHAHIDHVLGNSAVKEKYNIPFYLHQKDLATLHAVTNYAGVYGFQGYKTSPDPDFYLEDGSDLILEDIAFKVLFTPGHAPGHVVFYNKENKFVINGDVLFNGSFGRVDLPGGDLDILKSSIFEIMFELPEETVVYCGHGPETTIENEKKTNYIHQF